jgi:hypothetical protein
MSTRIERERHSDLARVVDQIPGNSSGGTAARIVTTTTITTYPTSAAEFYACNPTEIDGTETEGGSASYTVDADQVLYVLNVGTAIPPSGTRVVAHAVGGRWVMRYDG